MKRLISYILGISLLLSTPAISLILLDQEMSPEDQKRTGVSKLTELEQRNLEEWLGEKFQKKSEHHPLFDNELYVSEVINEGQQLRLSDNTLYEIAPEDWVHSQAWIALTHVQVQQSKNPYYPFTIINPRSGYQVRARLIDADLPETSPSPKGTGEPRP